MIYKKLSVVITTFNRSKLLSKVLFSLLSQTLSPDSYEIIIINDGSVDDTKNIIQEYSTKLEIIYLEHQNSGLAFSRNIGFENTSGDIILFLDDDDVLCESYLEEHLRFHNQFPSPNTAMLGYTALDEKIKIDPLMNYVTRVEYLLYSYPGIKHTQKLNYHYAWGGRTSFKRSLLEKESQLFNPIFKFGCEDIELGYRLSKHSSFNVLFNKNAVSYTIRNISFEDFCARMFKQGESSYKFLVMHNQREISEWIDADVLEDHYFKIIKYYPEIIESTKRFDCLVRDKIADRFDVRFDTKLLHKMYALAFKSAKSFGFMSSR